MDSFSGFGHQLTLTYGYDRPVNEQIAVSLSRNNHEFKLGIQGDGYLERLGYDRAVRAETEPQIEDHILGDLLVKQAAYGIKHEFGLRLQQLTDAKATAIEKMVLAQGRTRKLIKLDDEILAYRELAPRTRYQHAAIFGADNSGGFTTYYTSFLVWLKIARRVSFGNGRIEMDLAATERGQPLIA
jgi:hypothetical protein